MRPLIFHNSSRRLSRSQGVAVNRYGKPITSNLNDASLEVNSGFLEGLSEFVAAVNEPVISSSAPSPVNGSGDDAGRGTAL